MQYYYWNSGHGSISVEINKYLHYWYIRSWYFMVYTFCINAITKSFKFLRQVLFLNRLTSSITSLPSSGWMTSKRFKRSSNTTLRTSQTLHDPWASYLTSSTPTWRWIAFLTTSCLELLYFSNSHLEHLFLAWPVLASVGYSTARWSIVFEIHLCF